MTTTARKLPDNFGATVDDYMDLPGAHRGELVDGVITSMAPCSPLHGRIQARMALLIGQHLSKRGGPCWVGTEPGVQPRVQANYNVRIPDLGVSCTSESAQDRFMRDPLLLVEILSPGNGKDTSNNVMAYATIPTVQEVLVVDSTQRAIRYIGRNADGSWPELLATVAEGEPLTLTSIGLTLTIAEVYAGTALDVGA